MVNEVLVQSPGDPRLQSEDEGLDYLRMQGGERGCLEVVVDKCERAENFVLYC